MVTATQVNELRKMTGAGMMECKNALVETNGDMEEAIDVLRKKGAAKAAKKADRETSEGTVFVKIKGKKGAIVAIGCETDFVAKNEKFQEFGKKFVEKVFENGEEKTKIEAEEKLKDLIGTIGENMKIIDVREIEAETIGSYTHTNGKIGVLVGLKGGNEHVATDIAMHAAAMNPIFLSPEDVSDDLVKREKGIWIEQLKAEGKPEKIIENIMKGKENKFRGESSLKTQPFVKDPSQTVEAYASSAGAEITTFVRIAI